MLKNKNIFITGGNRGIQGARSRTHHSMAPNRSAGLSHQNDRNFLDYGRRGTRAQSSRMGTAKQFGPDRLGATDWRSPIHRNRTEKRKNKKCRKRKRIPCDHFLDHCGSIWLGTVGSYGIPRRFAQWNHDINWHGVRHEKRRSG